MATYFSICFPVFMIVVSMCVEPTDWHGFFYFTETGVLFASLQAGPKIHSLRHVRAIVLPGRAHRLALFPKGLGVFDRAA